MWRVGIIAILIAVGALQAQGVCNVCNENTGTACISENQFHLCTDDGPDTSQTYTCPQPNQICTIIGSGCLDKAEQENYDFSIQGCGDTSACGNCENLLDGSWACTSRNTFSMCIDNNVTDISSTCKDDLICNADVGKDGSNPCVSHCEEKTATMCDRASPIDDEGDDTTTTLSSTTDDSTSTINPLSTTTEAMNTTGGVGRDECKDQQYSGRYPNPNDSTCTSYIYCYRRDGIMDGNVLLCPEGKYFNQYNTLCESTKPASCT